MEMTSIVKKKVVAGSLKERKTEFFQKD